MTNISKSKLKDLCKAVLDNTLSIAANNLTFEVAIAFNLAQSIPESERNKEKELEVFMRAINVQMEQAKKQAMIYIDDLVLNDLQNYNSKNENLIKKLKYKEAISEKLLPFGQLSTKDILHCTYDAIKNYTEETIKHTISVYENLDLTAEDYNTLLYYKSLLRKSQTEF